MPTLKTYQNATVDTGLTYLTIPAAGTTAAEPINLIGVRALCIVTFADFLACTLTFQTLPFATGLAVNPGNVLNSDLANLDNFDGTTYTIAAQAGKRQIALDPTIFCNVPILNITSSVNQTTGGNIMIVGQPIWQGIHS